VRIDHVGLWAVDLERLRAFYETYLGGHSGPRFEDPRYGFASYLVAFREGARLELMSMPSIPPTRNDPLAQFTGLVHVAFSAGSREAVDDLAARLAADRIEITV
jgi:lactoylglutathione lyase